MTAKDETTWFAVKSGLVDMVAKLARQAWEAFPWCHLIASRSHGLVGVHCPVRRVPDALYGAADSDGAVT